MKNRPKQQPAERLDISRDLVAVPGLGQEEPGQ
jgi:hypothetical protein